MNVLEILHRLAFMVTATRADSLECRAPIYCRSRNQDIPSNTHELFPEPYLETPWSYFGYTLDYPCLVGFDRKSISNESL